MTQEVITASREYLQSKLNLIAEQMRELRLSNRPQDKAKHSQLLEEFTRTQQTLVFQRTADLSFPQYRDEKKVSLCLADS